jgi:hypothetical protein
LRIPKNIAGRRDLLSDLLLKGRRELGHGGRSGAEGGRGC